MTNAPPSRKTHVIRICGTNKNGDVLQDIWADIERIDVSKSATQTLKHGWQGHQRKNRWMDDPDADDYNPDGNPARKQDIVKLCDPQSADINDPEEWIPVPVIRYMKSTGYDGDNNTGTQSKFHTGDGDGTDPSITTRVVEVRKISHCDTSIDSAAQAAFDADPGRKAYVVTGDQYEKDLTTKDDTQSVDHEIITILKHRYNETNDEDGSVDRGLQTKLLNRYLIDESDPADGTVVGANGINPPYRLDPWQNIVNINFRTIYLVVQVDGGNNSFSLGPFGSAPGVAAPSLESAAVKSSARLLDTVTPPGGNNTTSGFLNCFTYSTGEDPEAAWTAWTTHTGPGGEFAAVNNSCPWPGPGAQPPDVSVAPVNFEASSVVARNYLYAIPSGDGVVEVGLRGIAAPSSSGDGVSTLVTVTGGGNIRVAVYSTVKGPRITKLSQLIDFTGDGKPRPTEDDACILGVDSNNQGRFLVNVKLDNDKADAQTNNYGKTFQPFKATLNPSSGTTDIVPSQPPPRLPNP